MSFFKDFKDDIAQAVGETGDASETPVTDMDDMHKGDSSESFEHEVQDEINSVLQDKDVLLSVSSMDSDIFEGGEASSEDADGQSEKKKKKEGFEMQEEEKEAVQETEGFDAVQESEDMADGGEMYNSRETTVITKGTTINGGIKSDTSLIVKGVIEGDVECEGKLTITGRVAGNSTASEIYINTPRLTGNLVSKGSVKVDVGTVVIGSISSASVVVAGAVKGDIDVNGPIIVDSTAVVQGNIIGKSIQINSGAVVDGMCSLKYADVDLDLFFE